MTDWLEVKEAKYIIIYLMNKQNEVISAIVLFYFILLSIYHVDQKIPVELFEASLLSFFIKSNKQPFFIKKLPVC